MEDAWALANRQSLQSQAIVRPPGKLRSQQLMDPEYRATYLSAASRLMDELEDLRIIHVDSQHEEKTRTQIALYLLTGFETAFHRLRPETYVQNVGLNL